MRSQRFRHEVYDFSRGTVGNLSDLKLGKVNFLKRSSNVVFTPTRGTRSRAGSRAISSATLDKKPHSLGKYMSTSGANKMFVGAESSVYEAGLASYAAQSLPIALNGGPLSFEQLNDVLFCAEHLGGHKPVCYIGTSWEKVELPIPVAGAVAVGAGGNVDVGTHHYRVRNLYTNGGSKAYYVGSVVLGVASIVNFTLFPTVAPGGRADWRGWVLERTKANDPLGALGLYYRVFEGNGATPSPYPDNSADVNLWDAVTDGWYTGPQEFDGFISHRGRMFGWKGSLLYPSWEIGGDAGTGIMNFDPLNALRAGSDDGDTILAAKLQGARAVIFKNRSSHFLEGSDFDSFNVVDIPDAGGIAGPRCACTVNGTTIVFYNEDGLFIMRASTPEPFGWVEMGEYISSVNPARRSSVVLTNVGNRYLFMSYSAGVSLYNNEAIMYDFNTRTWSHFTEFNAEDMLFQQDTSFASSRIIVADGMDRGAPPAHAYQLYSEMSGQKLRRASNDTGGVTIPARYELPSLDGGSPTTWKDLERVEVSLEGTATDYSVTIISDTGASFSATVRASGGGKDWCEDVAVHADDLEWDVGEWGADDQVGGTPIGVQKGMLGKRFSVVISAFSGEVTGVRGIAIDGRVRPERRKV